LSMCFTICHGKRLGETLKLLRLSRILGASRSRPASRKLQRFVLVSSRMKFWTSQSWRHGSRVSSWSRAYSWWCLFIILFIIIFMKFWTSRSWRHGSRVSSWSRAYSWWCLFILQYFVLKWGSGKKQMFRSANVMSGLGIGLGDG